MLNAEFNQLHKRFFQATRGQSRVSAPSNPVTRNPAFLPATQGTSGHGGGQALPRNPKPETRNPDRATRNA